MASKPNAFAANTICDRAKRSSWRVCVLIMEVSAQSEISLRAPSSENLPTSKAYSLPKQTVDLGVGVWIT